MDAYDLIVIGSGTAAQVAIAKVRAAGWSVDLRTDWRPEVSAAQLGEGESLASHRHSDDQTIPADPYSLGPH